MTPLKHMAAHQYLESLKQAGGWTRTASSRPYPLFTKSPMVLVMFNLFAKEYLDEAIG